MARCHALSLGLAVMCAAASFAAPARGEPASPGMGRVAGAPLGLRSAGGRGPGCGPGRGGGPRPVTPDDLVLVPSRGGAERPGPSLASRERPSIPHHAACAGLPPADKLPAGVAWSASCDGAAEGILCLARCPPGARGAFLSACGADGAWGAPAGACTPDAGAAALAAAAGAGGDGLGALGAAMMAAATTVACGTADGFCYTDPSTCTYPPGPRPDNANDW
jgi:hypothetical protein